MVGGGPTRACLMGVDVAGARPGPVHAACDLHVLWPSFRLHHSPSLHVSHCSSSHLDACAPLSAPPNGLPVCPPRTEWLLVTNGDNEYGAGFLSRALAEGGSDQVQGAEGGMEHGGRADIVAFDFYSRFQRVTAPSCERFAVQTQRPLCKRNRMRWCHTDLGANVLRYARFVSEGRSFGGPLAPESGLGAPHADGLLAQSLVTAGWRVRHVTDACLFSHAPNAQSCAWQHGVWDDREVGPGAGDAAGGECLTHGQAEWVLRNDPNAEILDITAASDGHVEGEGYCWWCLVCVVEGGREGRKGRTERACRCHWC